MKKCFVCLCFAAVASAQLPRRDPTLDRVVATVDGKNITYLELQKMIEASPPQLKQMFQTNPQSAIMQYHIIQFLGQEGQRRELDKKSPLKEELEVMRFNILAGAVVNNERDAFPVENEMIDAYYNAHRAEYEQSTMKAIFVAFKPDVNATGGAQNLQSIAETALGAARSNRPEADARAIAETAVKRARAGEDFVRLVEEFSEDRPSKIQRGDFGVLKASSTFPADFKKAVSALKPGEISDPIRQSTGFYIIRVESRELAPLAEVRADIVQEIRQDHLGQWLNGLNQRFMPQIKDPSILQPTVPQGVR